MTVETPALSWLFDFKRHGSQLGLERITYLLAQLQNPHQKFQSIHITGTNGKGSICQYITSVLTNAGYNTGMYISPHLERFTERISINHQEITSEDLTRLINTIRPVVEQMQKNEMTPTFFEITTALAVLYFAKQGVDYAVVEVGLGGRYDATNVLSPQVSVISNISLEHTARLGEHVEEIAFEKAGIIKADTPVVTATEGSALQTIKEVAKKQNAPVIQITRERWKRIENNTTHQTFHIHGSLQEYTVTTAQLGEYQGENISLAIAAVEQLQLQGIFLAEHTIETGIHDAFNPGRMELFGNEPLLLLDGAHNSVGMQMLAKALSEDFVYQKMILVLGILKDKAVDQMLATIAPLASHIIVTQPQTQRASSAHLLEEKLRKQGYPGKITRKTPLSEAVDTALKVADKEDLICISGSLYTIGEARRYLKDLTVIRKTRI